MKFTKLRLQQIQNKLDKIEKQIQNILQAIMDGFVQEEFKLKLEELKSEKIELQEKQAEYQVEVEKTRC